MKIPFWLEELAKVERKSLPVTAGIPFARGVVSSNQSLSLEFQGQEIPLQIQVLDRWNDDSLKWVLLDFQTDLAPLEKKQYHLTVSEKNSSVDYPVSIQLSKTEDLIRVETGGAQFEIGFKNQLFFKRVILRKQIGFNFDEEQWVFIDDRGVSFHPVAENITTETLGPLRTTLKVEGKWRSKNNKELARFGARFYFFSGSSACRIEWTLWNPKRAKHAGNRWDLGDPGSILFQEMGMHLKGADFIAPEISWQMQGNEKLKMAKANSWSLYQASSGGIHWNSHNHANRHGQATLPYKGYELNYDSHEEHGNRADPAVAMVESRKGIAVGIDKFWQNFPKAIEVKNGEFVVGLFPKQNQDFHELQGGERKTDILYLIFNDKPAESVVAQVKSFVAPIKIMAKSSYYAQTGVFGDLSLPSEDTRKDYTELVHSAIQGNYTFFDRREIIDEYGWRNFGCLYSDHDAVNYKGEEPLVSHFNNQYDALKGFVLHYLRSGDCRWWELARDLAQHTIDIDIYHTQQDKSAYNGGYFWHTEHYRDAGLSTHRTYTAKPLVGSRIKSGGGGLSNEHNYTTGLLYYYFLTGNQQAKEAVIELADWVMSMEDGSKTIYRFIDKGDTGLSSQIDWGYQGPGRGAGNSLNALLDAALITSQKKYLERLELLIRRCCHPDDNIKKRELDQPETRWSYLVFFQALGRYLDWKLENQTLDKMFYYARKSLIHYARWMLENEVLYAEVKNRVEIWSETWPAQDMRKSDVFKFAAKYSDELEQKKFLEKSEYFFNRSLDDLGRFETKILTRPLVIIMNSGLRHGVFHRRASSFEIIPDVPHHFGEPVKFVPQRVHAFRKMILVGIISTMVISLFAIMWYLP